MDSTMTKIHNRHSNNEDSIGLPVHILQLYKKEIIIFDTLLNIFKEKNCKKTIEKLKKLFLSPPKKNYRDQNNFSICKVYY